MSPCASNRGSMIRIWLHVKIRYSRGEGHYSCPDSRNDLIGEHQRGKVLHAAHLAWQRHTPKKRLLHQILPRSFKVRLDRRLTWNQAWHELQYNHIQSFEEPQEEQNTSSSSSCIDFLLIVLIMVWGTNAKYFVLNRTVCERTCVSNCHAGSSLDTWWTS